MYYFKLALTALALVTLSGCESGFQDEDIANVKQGIRSEYEQRGLTVNEVNWSRKTPRP